VVAQFSGAAAYNLTSCCPPQSLSILSCPKLGARSCGCSLLEEIGYDMSCPSPLLFDNKSALQVVKHPEHQSTMKHIHRAYHWIHGHINHGLITVSHIPGDANPTDIFTKPLGRVKFLHFHDMLGLCA